VGAPTPIRTDYFLVSSARLETLLRRAPDTKDGVTLA